MAGALIKAQSKAAAVGSAVVRSAATGSQDFKRETKNSRHTLRANLSVQAAAREAETAEQTETKRSLAARKLYDEQVREGVDEST